MIGIYKITNIVNNKSYIGQSINIEKRWKDHFYAFNNIDDKCYEYPLYRAMRKYGYDSFKFEVIEECSKELLNEREMYWIEKFDTYSNGYNQTLGGDSCTHSSKLSVEQVLEIQEKLLTQKYTLKELAEEYNVNRDTIRDINNGWTWNYLRTDLSYPLYISVKNSEYKSQKNTCKKCGSIISDRATLCAKCYTEQKSMVSNSKYPDKDQLIKDIKELGFTGAGRKYGVTDNSVRKHCLKIGLSDKSKDYKEPKRVRTFPLFQSVNQYDLEEKFIQSFDSYADAAKWIYENGYCKTLNGGVRSHIGDAANGKRKTAYKFIWRNAE